MTEQDRPDDQTSDPRLDAIVARMSRLVDVEYIPTWLDTPLRPLGDVSPRAMFARGDAAAVEALVEELETGLATEQIYRGDQSPEEFLADPRTA
jgi:hypothetical protein